MNPKRTAYRALGRLGRPSVSSVPYVASYSTTWSFDEDHWRRLLGDDVNYDNAERVHTSIEDPPVGRPVESRPSERAEVIGLSRVGNLHHRYRWREAA